MTPWRAGLVAGCAADGVLMMAVILAGLAGHGPAPADAFLLAAFWLVYLLPFGVLLSVVLTRLPLSPAPRPWLAAGATLGGLLGLAGFAVQVRDVGELLVPVVVGAGLGAVVAGVVRRLRGKSSPV